MSAVNGKIAKGKAIHNNPIHPNLTTKIAAAPIATNGKVKNINTKVIFVYIVLKSDASILITFPISAFLIIN